MDCHKSLEPYNATEKRFNEIRLQHLERGVGCSLECHADTIAKIAKSNYEQWTKSKHALVGVTCDQCHGGNPQAEDKETAHANIGTAEDENSPVYYRNVPETCGKCHVEEYTQFRNSTHYQKLEALEQAPTCTTCHNPHLFKVLDPSNMQAVCQNCHSVEAGIAPADIPLKAKRDLEAVGRLKSRINRAEEAIQKARIEGKTIPESALEKLEESKDTLNHIPVVWHRFDLPVFEGAINSAAEQAQKAEKEIIAAGIEVTKTPEETTAATPQTPAPGIPSLIITLSIAFLIAIRRKR